VAKKKKATRATPSRRLSPASPRRPS
jgi:hypothetical protein